MGHSQAGVVERCGGYGVLNNEARVITTTRQPTLKAGTWIWSAVLLAVFAVSFVTIQVVAHLAPLQGVRASHRLSDVDTARSAAWRRHGGAGTASRGHPGAARPRADRHHADLPEHQTGGA